MKKYIIAIALLFCFSNSSHAWVNLVLSGAEIAAPFVVQAGVKYLLPASSTTNVPSYGTATSTTVTKNAIGSYSGKSMTVALSIGTVALMEYIRSNPSLYPSLNSSTQKPSYETLSSVSGSNIQLVDVGDNVVVSGTTFRVMEKNSYDGGCDINQPSDYTYFSAGYFYRYVYSRGGSAVCSAPALATQYSVLKLSDIPNISPVTYTPLTAEQFSTALNSSPSAQSELSNVLVANPSLATYPSAEVIANSQAVTSATASTTATAAQTAAQTAVNTAQTAYAASPSPATQLQLDQAKAALAQLEAQQAQQAKEDLQEEVLTEPSIPTNAYDSSAIAPDKKEIPSLLSSFVASSPLVAMVRTFTMSASGSGVVPIGEVYGNNMNFDFTRWESTFRTVGGILLVIMHGFAILVVIRGW